LRNESSSDAGTLHQTIDSSKIRSNLRSTNTIGTGPMQVRSRSDYEIAHREVVAEGADLRVQVDARRRPVRSLALSQRDYRQLCLPRRPDGR